MIKKPIKDLTQLEIKILRFHILNIHSITIGLSTDITFPNIHPTDTKNAISNLVQYEYFKDAPPRAVVFTDDGYHECQIYFKFQLRRKRILNTIKTLLTFSRRTDKEWYEKPYGIVLLALISTLLAAYLVYYFGWNASKEQNKSQHEVQEESATISNKIPKKIPSKPPMLKK